MKGGNEINKTKKSQSPKNIEYNQIMERYGNLLVDSIENLPSQDKNFSLNTFSYNNKIIENKEINNVNNKDTVIRTYNSNKEIRDDDKENTTVTEKEINLLKKQNEEILIESRNMKELIYNQNNRISNLEKEMNLVRELSKKIDIIMKEKSLLTEKIRCLEIENNSKDNIINYLEKITKIKDDNENKIINSDKISYNTNIINTEKNSNTDNYFYDYSNTNKINEDKKNYSNEDSKLKSEIDYFDKEIQNLYKVMNNINNI